MTGDPPLLAKYANWFNIGHNNYEFLFDFGQFHGGDAEPMVHTRIIAGPAYAKALARLLNDSVDQYESAFGRISDPTDEEQGPVC